MPHAELEVADIFRRHGPAYRQAHSGALGRASLRVMRAIELCRTAALGGHVEQCDACSHQRIAYNSCRNRHCPKCQTNAREKWLSARLRELLPVRYFHLVFSVPHALAPLMWQNKVTEYDQDGKVIWEANVMQPMAACRLPNGNTLVSTQNWPTKMIELDRSGKQVAETGLPGFAARLRRR